MKKLSRIFLIIGKVTTIIELVSLCICCAVCLIAGIVGLANTDIIINAAAEQGEAIEAQTALAVAGILIAVSIILLIYAIVVCSLGIKFTNNGLKALANATSVKDVKGKGIACIIIAVLCGNDFTLAGGILLVCLRERHFANN